MEQVGGWLWALLGIGVIALGAAMVYGTNMWQHRRKDYATKRHQAEVTRENYQKGG